MTTRLHFVRRIRSSSSSSSCGTGRVLTMSATAMMMMTALFVLASTQALLSVDAAAAAASSGTISTPQQQQQMSSLPRSKSSRRWSSNGNNNGVSSSYPPWNPSPRIHHDGFLREAYTRIPGEWEDEVRLRTRQRLETACRIRQVPGDGNCLFHSISLCLQHANNGTHWDLSKSWCLNHLYRHSNRLRQQAVNVLRDPRKRLFLQGRESLKSGELVEAAAQQYGLSSDEYCQAMQQDCVWGGGPEIVALSNILKRPIHVYELHASPPVSVAASNNNNNNNAPPCFVLRRMACFGSPRFDQREALHILSADSRFPDLIVGEQLKAGNHFLAVFPLRPPRSSRRGRLRGGGASRNGARRNSGGDGDEEEILEDDDLSESSQSRWSLWKNWWKHLNLLQ